MFASTRIVLILTVAIASSLSKETITKERLAEKDFPIRVLVSPSSRGDMVSFQFQFDHEKNGGRVHAELVIKEPTSSKKLAVVPVEFHRFNMETVTIAKINLDSEFALSCDMVISSWIGSAERQYHIPLKIFADELKDMHKAAKK